MKMYVRSLQMCFIGFIDLKNIGIDIKIMVIGALRAILWAKTCFVAAILNFLILGWNSWNDVVVPAIVEISIPKKTYGKVSCFFPEVHNSSKNCYISAPLRTHVLMHQRLHKCLNYITHEWCQNITNKLTKFF